MALFGLIGLPDLGHVNPSVALAWNLRQRGHRVIFFQVEDLKQKILDAGLEFRVIGSDVYPSGSLVERHRALSKLNGLSSVRRAIELTTKFSATLCRDVPGQARSCGVEAFIVDQFEPAGTAVADALKLPFVTVCNGLAFHEDVTAPPGFTNWRFKPGISNNLRNWAAFRWFDVLSLPVRRVVNAFRRSQGLPVQRRFADTFSKLAQISQQPPALEFPYKQVPDHLHYTGPFGTKLVGVEFPWERLSEERMIYASLGTLQNLRLEAFRCIIEACEGLDVQLVVSHGHGLTHEQVCSLPQWPLIVSYAPQSEVLARAALTITHAGLNTVLDSLSAGVPMVAIPILGEQPGIAERVRWAGAGEVVPWTKLTRTTLRSAVIKVLSDNSYQTNANRIRRSILQAGGVVRAAEIIEMAAQTQRPVVAELNNRVRAAE